MNSFQTPSQRAVPASMLPRSIYPVVLMAVLAAAPAHALEPMDDASMGEFVVEGLEAPAAGGNGSLPAPGRTSLVATAALQNQALQGERQRDITEEEGSQNGRSLSQARNLLQQDGQQEALAAIGIATAGFLGGGILTSVIAGTGTVAVTRVLKETTASSTLLE